MTNTVTNMYEELEPRTRTFLANLQHYRDHQFILCHHTRRAVYYPDFRPASRSSNLKQLLRIALSPVPAVSDKEISITIVRPPDSINETLPVIMYFHGGGWILNGFDTHERLVRELANKANAAIVFVNYTRSPEAKYPISLEQAYAAIKLGHSKFPSTTR